MKFPFFPLKKSLYIAWACFRNDISGTLPLSLAVFAGPDTSSTPTLCGEYDGNILDGSTAILCHEGVTGQVVKIELRQSGILGLCEVEIYEVVRYSRMLL